MQAVSENIKKTLTNLFEIKEMENFYLAGGTNLALKYEHRVSTDIDLFCLPNLDLNLEQDVLPQIEKTFLNLKKDSIGKQVLRLNIDSIKVDFLNFHEIRKMIKAPYRQNNWLLADSLDVASMKISAIINRGTRKDFIDLAFLLQKYSLKEIIDAYKFKYDINSDQQVIKYLVDFHEADSEGERSIQMIQFKAHWNDVKALIISNLENYLNKQK